MQRTRESDRIPTPALFTAGIQDAKNKVPHLYHLQEWYKMQRTKKKTERIPTPVLFTVVIQDAKKKGPSKNPYTCTIYSGETWCKNMGPRKNPYTCTIYSGDTICKEHGTQTESLHLHYLQWWYMMQRTRDPERIPTPALFTAMIQDAQNKGPRENPYTCTIYSGDTRCKEQGTQRESLHLHCVQKWNKVQRTNLAVPECAGCWSTDRQSPDTSVPEGHCSRCSAVHTGSRSPGWNCCGLHSLTGGCSNSLSCS